MPFLTWPLEFLELGTGTDMHWFLQAINKKIVSFDSLILKNKNNEINEKLNHKSAFTAGMCVELKRGCEEKNYNIEFFF